MMKINTSIEVAKRILHPWQWAVQSDLDGVSIANKVLPRMWNDMASKKEAVDRVFCTSRADVFDSTVPQSWRDELFKFIAETPNLDWVLPTKFIANAADMLPLRVGALLPNVWIGAVIGSQAEADRDCPILFQVPAVNRLVCIDQLQGPLDLSDWLDLIQYEDGAPWGRRNIGQLHDMLDWVIVGASAGPMHPNWLTALRDQCAAAAVPFFFKMWGDFIPRSSCYHVFEDGLSAADLDPSCEKWPNVIRLTEAGQDGRHLENSGDGDDCYMQKVGSKRAGRLLKGQLCNGVPV